MITLKITPDGVILPIRVTPKGGKNCVLPYAEGDDRVRVKVSAPPEDGKANAAVIELFSDVLAVPKRCISIASGETSRMKMLLLAADADVIAGRLNALLEHPAAIRISD